MALVRAPLGLLARAAPCRLTPCRDRYRRMKTAEAALAICVVGLACFITGQAIGVRRATALHVAAGAIGERIASASDSARSDSAASPAVTFGTAEPEMRISESLEFDAPEMEPAEMRRRIADGAAGTYIDELVTARDSALIRWPDRRTRPLRVWIAEDEQMPGWNPDFVIAVRDAFETWTLTGIPVHFIYVVDSATADVHVRFTERFANGISGKTVWSRDSAWWLVSSNITLGLAHPGGGTVSPPQMRAIALHEVGHLLGLDHSAAPDHIMSARIRVRDLTEPDRATIKLLYSVPAGLLR